MNHDDNSTDPLDTLFANQPVKPTKDFAERTLARLEQELTEQPEASACDAELDALLESQPLKPRGDLADRVLAELGAEAAKPTAEPEDNKVVGFPSWVVAIGSIAALMVLGMFSFITLFDHAKNQPTQIGGSDTYVQTTQPDVDTSGQPVVGSVTPEIATLDTVTVEYVASAESAPDLDALIGIEETTGDYNTVLTLDETLEDALLLADLETLNSLQAFLN
ncbi:hypothetical protein [Cerasicoccus maritimus]|uniref:hypothetical protein n=1 Tax=Cerasicoccus maritimus TaxID=490089 RepID=UPI00285260B3|nr:hypothetical protein [Cerasicoccus maritimus]